jgi:hypothetical protein
MILKAIVEATEHAGWRRAGQPPEKGVWEALRCPNNVRRVLDTGWRVNRNERRQEAQFLSTRRLPHVDRSEQGYYPAVLR